MAKIDYCLLDSVYKLMIICLNLLAFEEQVKKMSLINYRCKTPAKLPKPRAKVRRLRESA